MWPILNEICLKRRSIRRIWHKELLYFCSNHPLYIFASIAIFTCFYNLWWTRLPEPPVPDTKWSANVKIFDNFRFAKHKFVRILICIPDDVVDYRFSTVTDAIQLLHLDYPDVHFLKSLDKAKMNLDTEAVDILILFTTLIETGRKVDYNIISRMGELNKDYCTACDSHRKLVWGHAIEAQVVVNRFLYWLVKARGFTTRAPHWQLSNVYIDEEETDRLFSKRQADLFVAWLTLLPICYRLIKSWNDDRKSGFYKVLQSLGVSRFCYFFAKFQFWYFFALLISMTVWTVNVSLFNGSFISTFVPFMIVYIACIVAFAIFLISLFPDSPNLAAFVGLLMMAAGEFGYGKVGHGVLFFQLSVRFFGRSLGDASRSEDTIAVMCMILNFFIMALLSIYMDTYFYSYSSEPVTPYFFLERAYWMPEKRHPQIDKTHLKQILPPPKPDRKQKEKSEQVVDKPLEMKDDLMGKPILILYGICKQINGNWRLNTFSLSIRYGEVTTLYGHRGCGSEEVMAIIAGKMQPEYGEVVRDKMMRPLVIAQATEVPDVNYLNVNQYLKLISQFRGFSLSTQFLEQTLKDLDLEKVRSRPLDLLSTTQKERLRIAAAFVGSPDVVLIDSPTQESPPQWKYMILNYIESQKDKRAIVISSYDEEETDAVSDRIVLLSEGYVILNGPAETYRQSMSSVFEIRMWPMVMFTDVQIRGLMEVITLGDDKMRDEVKYVETPNGKLRFIIPTVYRRCMHLIFTDLESCVARYDVAYFEISKPSIQDVYTNACYESRQYAPLANYHILKEHYANQVQISQTMFFFKNLLRILKEKTFLMHVGLVVGAFCILGLITVISWQKTHTHYTHEISLETHDHPVTIYCADCFPEKASSVTYLTTLGQNEIQKNQAFLFWRNNTSIADAELVSVSRGDVSFTMLIQNFAISQMIYKLTGHYPKITPTLENADFRKSSTRDGFSMLFRDVNKNQAAMILAGSHSLLYILGMFQTFVFTLSTLLPLRLVQVNMRPTTLLFPWPRYLYYGLIFGTNIVCFIVISVILTIILLSFGMFETNTVGCSVRFLLAWLLVYTSTLPLIYWLVFSVNNATAVIPTVMAVSSMFVNLPNIVSSFSAENAVSLQSLLTIVSWTSMICPPTALQVLAAFLNAGEFHAENADSILAFTIACVMHSWTIIVFVVCIYQPGFGTIRQSLFLAKISLFSKFTRGTTLPPGARLMNTAIFSQSQPQTPKPEAKTPVARTPKEDVPAATTEATGELKDRTSTTKVTSTSEEPKSRQSGGQEAAKEDVYENVGGVKSQQQSIEKAPESVRKPTIDYLAGERDKKKDLPPGTRRFVDPVSHITRFEEELIVEVSRMQRWDDKQEVPVDNSALYLLGDQSKLKSALLNAIVELNSKERIAYVPFVECLPTVFTPLELLQNVGACHGFEVTGAHINYLLDAFGMLPLAEIPIANLTDADRRILMLLTKLVIKPSMVILDQLDTFLPYAKMMTVWSLCSRLRSEGVGVVFASRHSSFAEHTATSCAHMNKCQFLRTIPPSSVKANLGCTVIDLTPNANVDINVMKGMFHEAFRNDGITFLPSMNRRFCAVLPADDIETLVKIMASIRTASDFIKRYSLRSVNFEEFVAMSFE